MRDVPWFGHRYYGRGRGEFCLGSLDRLLPRPDHEQGRPALCGAPVKDVADLLVGDDDGSDHDQARVPFSGAVAQPAADW